MGTDILGTHLRDKIKQMQTYSGENKLGEVHAFDFDGTLTTRDTLIEFIRFVRGDKFFFLCMLRHLPQLALMKFGVLPNWRVKMQVFSYCFRGMKTAAFNAYCTRFAVRKAHLIRPQGLETVRRVLSENGKVVIVSASVDNWVRPFFTELQGVYVLGTKIEERDGVLTGRFLTKNCYGEEKVRRLLQLFPERKDYRLTAYGDSRGDFALLDFADVSVFKPFRK